jgi:hypothetical protein
MSGNVLDERYRVISLQFESRRHLENTLAERAMDSVLAKLMECRKSGDEFARWFVQLPKDQPISDLTLLHGFQRELASTAGMVMKNILAPAWQAETNSLIFSSSGQDKKATDDGVGDTGIPTEKLACHVRAAEEFFVLPYLAFIQNMLGRIRTMALGSLWLFVSTSVAVSSYPFDPLNVLGGIFLAVFLPYSVVTVLIYSQMSRDATLSHITNTNPGELGWDFWQRVTAFGIGPVIGLLTTLFPSISDFVFSWLEPSAQALK